MEFDVKDILERSKDEIVKQCVEAAKKEYSHIIYSTVRTEVQKAVEDEFKENLADEVRKQVSAARPAILAAVSQACGEIAVEAGKRLKETAIKNLDSSYHSSRLVEALFK